MENLQTGVERKRAKRPSLTVGFAHGQSEILDAQRLRYRVFAGEMGANLP
jgi:putative hemolysin